nr:thermonuclease family protein [Devosia pacifica]
MGRPSIGSTRRTAQHTLLGIALSGEQGSYGREIGTILIEGIDVGEILVAEGLARWWPDGEEWWCS